MSEKQRGKKRAEAPTKKAPAADAADDDEDDAEDLELEDEFPEPFKVSVQPSHRSDRTHTLPRALARGGELVRICAH